MTTGSQLLPRPPITLTPMVDDVDRLVDLVRGAGAFPPLQRGLYSNAAELAAMSSNPTVEAGGEDRTPAVRSSFRKFFGRNGEVVVPGAEELFRLERFEQAALSLHGGIEVRPVELYVNVNVPEREERAAHTDVPDFRGLPRRAVPSWLLVTMRRSGLFDRWHIPTCAMVGWIYGGRGGEYTYWPDGPERPARRTAQPFSNTAIVGENDTMFHRGEPVLAPDGTQRGIPGMSVQADLWPVDGGGWQAVDQGRRLMSFADDEVRLCISWTAEVIRSHDERRQIDDHLDDLTLEQIERTFTADLAGRGAAVPDGVDLLHDPVGIALIARTYSAVPVEVVAA